MCYIDLATKYANRCTLVEKRSIVECNSALQTPTTTKDSEFKMTDANAFYAKICQGGVMQYPGNFYRKTR